MQNNYLTYVQMQMYTYANEYKSHNSIAVVELDKEEDGKVIRAVMGDTLGRWEILN